MSPLYEVIVIGGGPGGIGSAIEAKVLGLTKILLIEKSESHSDTIRKYYKDNKRVDKDWKGQAVELEGSVAFIDGTKESTIEYFDQMLQDRSIEAKYKCEVEKITKSDHHFDVTTSCGVYHADHVIVSIGRMGKPNKPSYKIPPPLLGRVHFNLDKCSHSEDILVVGGGDSAVEYACELSEENRVTLCYRQKEITRPNPMNLSMLHQYASSALVTLKLGIDIGSVDEDEGRVRVNFVDGTSEHFDRIIYAIGGTTPTDFLKKCHITLDAEGQPIFDPLTYESEVAGLYLAGDIVFNSGGSIAIALNHGYRIVSHILSKK